MSNEINIYVTRLGSLIELLLRHSIQGSDGYLVGPLSPFRSPLDKERCFSINPCSISTISSLIHSQTIKEIFNLSSPFGGQGAYSPL